MREGHVFSSDRFRLTLCRGDSLLMEFSVRENDGGGCGSVVQGDPVGLAGYALSASGRVSGTDRYVPMVVRLALEGSDSTPAQFTLEATPGDLGWAFEEGAQRTIDVRVQASRVNDTFTLLKGTINMRDSASQVGA